jgi:hypothetical protein
MALPVASAVLIGRTGEGLAAVRSPNPQRPPPCERAYLRLQTSSYFLVTRGAARIPGRASVVSATRSCPAALCAGLPLHADGSALATPLVCQRAG